MTKRILSIMLAAFISLTCFVFSASAESTVDILVIGDSISTGYGLASADESFSSLFVSEKGYSVTNKAVDGNTASGIAAQLSTNAITEADIKSADIVTITCGGNDLMALFYNKIVTVWNVGHPDDQLTVADLPVELSNPQSQKRMALMTIALNLLDSTNPLYFIDDADFTQAVSDYILALNGIVDYIHSKNSNAKVIVATQYNPYVEFKGVTLGGFIKLDPLYSGMEEGVTALNNAIVSNASNGNYYVADVKSGFDAYNGNGDLYNACPEMAKLDVDFHPAAEGHKVISQVFSEVIDEVYVESSETGDATSDEASDGESPKTGDDENVLLWMIFLVLNLCAVYGIASSKRVRNI